MVGTRRLELLTSTVSILRDLSFQRLTFSAGAAKSLEGITKTRVLWVDSWVLTCTPGIALSDQDRFRNFCSSRYSFARSRRRTVSLLDLSFRMGCVYLLMVSNGRRQIFSIIWSAAL